MPLDLTTLNNIIKGSSAFLRPLEDDSYWIAYLQEYAPPQVTFSPRVPSDDLCPHATSPLPSPLPAEGFVAATARGYMRRSMDISNYIVESGERLCRLQERFPLLDSLHAVGASPDEAEDISSLPPTWISSFLDGLLSRPAAAQEKAIDLTREKILAILQKSTASARKSLAKDIPKAQALLLKPPIPTKKRTTQKDKTREQLIAEYAATHLPQGGILSELDAPALARETFLLYGVADTPDLLKDAPPILGGPPIADLIRFSVMESDYNPPERPLVHYPHRIADNFAWLSLGNGATGEEWTLAELYTLVTTPSPFCMVKNCLQIEIVQNRFPGGATIIPFAPPLIATCNKPFCPSFHNQHIDAAKAIRFINYANALDKISRIPIRNEQTLNFMGFAALLYEFASFMAGKTLGELINKELTCLNSTPSPF